MADISKQSELFPQEAPAKLLPRSIYLVIINDRHWDTEVIPFYDKEEALAYARKEVQKSCRNIEDLDETLHPQAAKAGYLYVGIYSCEGDNISVREETIR